MFYPNKSSILVSGEGNSSRSKMISFMRILNLQRIVFLMCIVSSVEITWGMKEKLKDKIKVEKLKDVSLTKTNFKYKVTFLGDTNVGKTQIIDRHVKGSFKEKYTPTVGTDNTNKQYQRTINGGNRKTIQLDILGTSGQEIFKTLLQNYIKNAKAIVFVYDITKKDSFNNIKEYWLEKAKEKAHKDAVYFLVGNKADLQNERKVEKDKAQEFAKENNMQFFEVSAKNGYNVNKLFEDIVKECLIKEEDIIKGIQKDKLEDSAKDNSNSKEYKGKINLNQQVTTPTNNKRCSCCPCNK